MVDPAGFGAAPAMRMINRGLAGPHQSSRVAHFELTWDFSVKQPDPPTVRRQWWIIG